MSCLQYGSCLLCTRRCCTSLCCCCRVDAPHDTAHHTHIVAVQDEDPDPEDTFMFQVIHGLRSAAEGAEQKFRGLKSCNEVDEPAFFNISSPCKGHGLVAMKDYAPYLFCQARTSQGVDTQDYLKSWSYAFDTMPRAAIGAGRSNSLFLKSADDHFILKTLPHHEVVTLRHILKAYFHHLEQNPTSRLLRFVGLHRFRRANRYLYVVVMSNIFYSPINLQIDYKYDLKGRKIKPSSEKRLKSLKGKGWPQKMIIKDNQLDRVFFPQDSENLRRALTKDADFLCSQNCIDYSLLVGVHLRSNADEVEQKGGRRNSVSLLKEGIPSDGYLRNETYFIGVIDFLSRYERKKKIANCCKSFLWEQSMLSTVPPIFYRDRWVGYLDKVLMNESKKSLVAIVGQTQSNAAAAAVIHLPASEPAEEQVRLLKQERTFGKSSVEAGGKRMEEIAL